MIVGILQPGYLPWLGFFEQMYRSDVFVMYDDVQYDKHGWRNRNRIKSPNGVQWLTVPVLIKGQGKPEIRDVRINKAERWQKKHIRTIEQNYRKAPFYGEYFGDIEAILSKSWDFLIDLDVAMIDLLGGRLGLQREVLFSSDLKITGDRVERLVKICQSVNGTTFYEGESGKNYIDEGLFASAGIKVVYQQYKHPVYPQLYGEFVPYLSAIDLLFNCGDKSLDIILGKN